MDLKFIPFLEQGRQLWQAGGVRDVTFSHATYQVEVVEGEERYWPLLHFDGEGKVNDAFCSCEAGEGGCVHLAAAYLKICATPNQRPLHEHFARSFFYTLFVRIADRMGYTAQGLVCSEPGHYHGIGWEILACTPESVRFLKALIEERTEPTPETSMHFSGFSAEEITWWREGRPSASLQCALSIYSDLAKWMLCLQFSEVYQVEYVEKEGLPLEWTFQFPSLHLKVELSCADLGMLIPTLDTIVSPLGLYKEAAGRIVGMIYDAERRVLKMLHEKPPECIQGEGLFVEGWRYTPGVGFYACEHRSVFDCAEIAESLIGEVLSVHGKEVAAFLPLQSIPMKMRYTLHCDAQWNLKISAYLFTPGERLQLFPPHWVYSEKGFIAISEMIFEETEYFVPASEVGHFVNRHRLFLNGQEGFQTHLASIEAHLGYTVTKKGLLFLAKVAEGEGEEHDFGEWMYYVGQGFFSKEARRIGGCLRPDLLIETENVNSFIKMHREELMEIPGFFALELPLAQRGLALRALPGHQLEVSPVYTLRTAYEGKTLQFFGDFVYLAGEGFYELPGGMRLPEGYQEKRLIGRAERHHFLAMEFPKLEPWMQTVDPTLRPPQCMGGHLHYLVRQPKGGLKVELSLVTEHGEVSFNTLLEGMVHGEGLLFTPAGLIDLRNAQWSWLQRCRAMWKNKMLEMSMLEFLRLDAVLPIQLAPTQTPHSDVTRMLLKELREGLISQPLVLQGLKSALRPYQLSGVQWLWFLYTHELSGLLCDDMGLGKTHQVMALMAAIGNLPDAEERHFLVVCPTSVIYHWQDKLKSFLPQAKVYTFHGLKRTLPNTGKGGIILTSYGILRMHPELWKQFQFDVAIYDEIQVAKNASSQVHEVLKTLSARMRVGLTGTPIENNLRELKALFDVVLPGYMPSEAHFREDFMIPIERDQSEEKRAQLSALVRPFVLRRKKKEVLDELPEKYEDLAYCDLSPEQRELYTEVLGQHRDALLVQLKEEKEPVPYMHVFALLSQLKQICDHPALVAKCPEEYAQHASGKWELCTELLAEARASDHKVVIFSQYLYMLDIFELYLQKQGWGYAQIRGDTIDRQKELMRFANDPSCVVFLGSLQAAGVGIDLTAANVVILYDRWWNAARENQAIDRVHRIGQKWAVQVFKLMTKGTIEENIDRMIARKGRLLEEIIASDDQAVVKKLTRAELIELLSYSSGENSGELQ